MDKFTEDEQRFYNRMSKIPHRYDWHVIAWIQYRIWLRPPSGGM